MGSSNWSNGLFTSVRVIMNQHGPARASVAGSCEEKPRRWEKNLDRIAYAVMMAAAGIFIAAGLYAWFFLCP